MTDELKTVWAEGQATSNGWLCLPHIVGAETWPRGRGIGSRWTCIMASSTGPIS
jgi:hypothetical protein